MTFRTPSMRIVNAGRPTGDEPAAKSIAAFRLVGI
jgi:hypothetical protein